MSIDTQKNSFLLKGINGSNKSKEHNFLEAFSVLQKKENININ